MKKIILAIVCVALASVLGLQAAEQIADTSAGKVRGAATNGVVVFKGIPYGADTSKRRFQPPVAVEPWIDVRDCTDFGPIAPQPPGTSSKAFHHADLPQSEDCLNLNLWTPALHDGRKRPVFVYFHGGGFDSQTGDLIDGAPLARRGDAVVVAVNHRLGGFGYLYLGDMGGAAYASSGNAGQLDLVLALQWVHANIAKFGGDPGNVTIFGESGGAAKCAMLMAMPSAQGLFHRVWSLSGSGVTGLTRQQGTSIARAVLAALGLKESQLGELQTLPREKLVAAFGHRPYAPVVDGAILPRDPFRPDATPLSSEIPMVLGTTHDEMSSFLIKNPQFANIASWDQAVAALRSSNQFSIGPQPTDIVAAYRRIYPDYSPKEAADAAVTASGLWRGIVVESERRAAQGGPTWVYCLNWPGRGKAAHAIDTALILDDPQENWRTAAETTGPAMAEIMSDAFLAFGRTGDPNTARLPRWPRFTLPQRPTMIFDLSLRVENDPRGAERELFDPNAEKHAPQPTAGTASEEIGPPYAVVAAFVGDWSASAGADQAGVELRLEMQIQWAENRQGLRYNLWLERGRERTPRGSGFFAWNPAEHRFVVLQALADGSLVTGDVTVSNSVLELTGTIIKLDGGSVKGRDRYTLEANTLLRENYGWEKNAWVKSAEFRYTRSTPSASSH